MRTVQEGDRVRVRYVKHWPDGTTASSGRTPLEVTAGLDPPRLPGLGKTLVGLCPGDSTTLTVPPERAHGVRDPARIYRLQRARFPKAQALVPGTWVRLTDRRGRRRLLRLVEVGERAVVVDTNHPRAGQPVRLELVVVSVGGAEADTGSAGPAESQSGRAALRG